MNFFLADPCISQRFFYIRTIYSCQEQSSGLFLHECEWCQKNFSRYVEKFGGFVFFTYLCNNINEQTIMKKYITLRNIFAVLGYSAVVALALHWGNNIVSVILIGLVVWQCLVREW